MCIRDSLQDAQPLGGKAAHQIAQEHRCGVVAHLRVGRDGAVRIARRIQQRACRVDRGTVAFKREEHAGKTIGRIGAGRDVGHGAKRVNACAGCPGFAACIELAGGQRAACVAHQLPGKTAYRRARRGIGQLACRFGDGAIGHGYEDEVRGIKKRLQRGKGRCV